jgi:hypothetical protein
MGYSSALTAAGAKVIDFKHFGDYQGTWGAIVDYNGERSLVTGSYGSCSMCDSYQAEFDRYGHPDDVYTRDGKYYDGDDQEITKEAYDIVSERENQRLAEFGMAYLTNPSTKDIVQCQLDHYNAKLDQDDWFDNEERELYDWAIRFF